MLVLTAMTRLADEMAQRHSLEALLQLIADRAAEILRARRVSVRLLDPSQTCLLAVARAGLPLHDRPQEFQIGEGLIGWIAEHGVALRTPEPEAHPSFVPREGMTEPMGAFLGVPIRAGSGVVGVVSVVDRDLRFTQEHEEILLLIAALSGPYVEIARLSRLSRVDPLTGSLNRRGLDEAFPEVASDVPGPIAPLSVIMADLDHFKRINDAYGHAVGDVVLRHVTSVLAGLVRGGDAVVRYGGEEFLLVLPRVDRERAALIAERARHALSQSPVAVPGTAVTVTLSMGVAERRAGEGRDSVIARADAALYEAKRAGRDRIALAE